MVMIDFWSDDFVFNLFNVKDKVVVIIGGNGMLGVVYVCIFVLYGVYVIVIVCNLFMLDEVVVLM